MSFRELLYLLAPPYSQREAEVEETTRGTEGLVLRQSFFPYDPLDAHRHRLLDTRQYEE